MRINNRATRIGVSSLVPSDTQIDSQLIEKARQGDLWAFEQVVLHHQDRLFGLAFRYLGNRGDAEDAVQETLLRAFRRLQRYDPRYSFTTWLYRIAANCCTDMLRRRRGNRVLALVNWLLPGMAEFPAEVVERNETCAMIRRVVSRLPQNYQEVLTLKYTEGLSYEQISRALGISRDNVETRLYRARKLLARRLENYWQGRDQEVKNGELRRPGKMGSTLL